VQNLLWLEDHFSPQPFVLVTINRLTISTDVCQCTKYHVTIYHSFSFCYLLFSLNILTQAASWWLTPVILATQETEIRKIVEKNYHKKRAGRVARDVGLEFKPQYHKKKKKNPIKQLQRFWLCSIRHCSSSFLHLTRKQTWDEKRNIERLPLKKKKMSIKLQLRGLLRISLIFGFLSGGGGEGLIWPIFFIPLINFLKLLNSNIKNT
jgi:hypothetical protein